MHSQRPNRPLVAAPLNRWGRAREWMQRVVSNGTALVALSVSVVVLSVAVLTLYTSVDRNQGAADCRSRISSSVARVEGDLNIEVARGLIALGNGDKVSREAAAAKAATIIVILDEIGPIRENSVDICNNDAGFTLEVPAYRTQDE